jgi:hypothetical protein
MGRIEYGTADSRASSGESSTRSMIARFKANCDRVRAQMPPEKRSAISFSMTGNDLVGRINGRIVYSSARDAATAKGLKARMLVAKIRARG